MRFCPAGIVFEASSERGSWSEAATKGTAEGDEPSFEVVAAVGALMVAF